MREITEKAKEMLKNKVVVAPVDATEMKERNINIGVLYSQDMTISEIGKLYGISKQRVSKILQTLGISKHEKAVENTKNKAIEKLQARVERYKASAIHNRELYYKERLKTLQLQNKVSAKEKKIAKLEKEVGRLTLLIGMENVNIKK